MNVNHYIYTRFHESYEGNIKLGKTTHLLERNNVYKTGELKPGKFNFVIQLKNETSIKVEKLLQTHFTDDHIYLGGGTEFYKNTIIDKICPFLDSINIQYDILSDDDINDLTYDKSKTIIKLDRFGQFETYNKFK